MMTAMSERADTSGTKSLAERSALVVGVTGIQGHTLATQLHKHGWNVTGLARRETIDLSGVTGVSVDLAARCGGRRRPTAQAALAGRHAGEENC
jgi:nucleoside-diphosphate-sugar epimerase